LLTTSRPTLTLKQLTRRRATAEARQFMREERLLLAIKPSARYANNKGSACVALWAQQ